MNAQPDRIAWFQDQGARCRPLHAPRGRPYRLVLLGPPGVGKGTQAGLLCQALGACHLSTGDLFRACQEQANPSPALGVALDAMRRGELVADAVVVALVRERVQCLACPAGFLLDGFPRTVAQAEALAALLAEASVVLDAVVCYDLPLEEVVARLGGRRSCPGCKDVYHIRARPPRVEGVCDGCGGRLVLREDDRPESIRTRMRAYAESTRPLAEYYERVGKLVTVQASGTPDEILRRSLQALSCRRE